MELGPLQKKWVEELRSGKHTQGMDYLCRDGMYCCLGVAAEFVLGINPKLLFSKDTHMMYNGRCDTLTMEDADRIGLHLSGIYACAKMNDSGASFDEIASEMESNPQTFFIESK